jgi:VanZ family protein
MFDEAGPISSREDFGDRQAQPASLGSGVHSNLDSTMASPSFSTSKGSTRPISSVGRGWTVAAVGVIVIVTLTPAPGGPPPRFFSFLLPPDARACLDVIANIALYVPLGLICSAGRIPRWRVLVTCAILSTATELLQVVVPGRDPSARDIIANTVGGSIGSGLLTTAVGRSILSVLASVEQWSPSLLRPTRPVAGVLSLAWAVTVAWVLSLTAFLLSPAPPAGRRYIVASALIDRAFGPVRIGSSGAADGVFRGLLDDARIYAHARAAESIRADMLRPVTPTMAAEPGLVAAYGFDAGIGSIALDDTGHQHNGEIHGASWIKQGRHGGALSFDGSLSEVFVRAASDLDLPDGMTLEAWVFPIGEPARRSTVIAHPGAYYLTASSEEGRFLAAGGGVFGSSNAETRLRDPIPVGTWTHLAATYDAQAIRLYVNGTLAVTRRLWSPHRPARMFLNGLDLPFGPVGDQHRLADTLRDDVHLQVTVICGSRQAAAGPVFLITSHQNVDALTMLAQDGDLLIRPWTWARRVRLSSPDYRVPGAFYNCEPDRRIEVTLTGPLQNPHVDRDGREMPGTALGLGSGWAFLIHSELLPKSVLRACTLTWLGLLMFPFGLWLRRRRTSAAGVVVLVAAFQLTPHLGHLPPLGAMQLAAVSFGGVLGAIYRRLTERLGTEAA